MTTALMFAAAAGLIALSAAVRWRQIRPLIVLPDPSTQMARVDLPPLTVEDMAVAWFIEDMEAATREAATP